MSAPRKVSRRHRGGSFRHRPVETIRQSRGVFRLVRRPVVTDYQVREIRRPAPDDAIQHAHCAKDADLSGHTAVRFPNEREGRNTDWKVSKHHLPRPEGTMRQAPPRLRREGVEIASAVAVTRLVTRSAIQTERRLHAGKPPKQPDFIERRALPLRRRQEIRRVLTAKGSDYFGSNVHASRLRNIT